MTEEKLAKIYRAARVLIFAIPVLVIVVGLYLVLFPVDSYSFYPNDSKLSKFEVAKNTQNNNLTFGVFPVRNFRFIQLSMNFKKSEKQNCQASNAEVSLEKTYEAFLLPSAETITNEDQLHSFLFDGDKAKYPNGSLLHLKPTNEVFIITHGKKILFPGPEIFQAFGYSFDDLTEVDQSEIDQFPDANPKTFLWTMPHPDGTIFQAFPSHSLYLIFDGKKYPIASQDLLSKVWPSNFEVAISDSSNDNKLPCKNTGKQNQVSCQFDSSKLSDIGGYFLFSMKFPENCQIENVHPDNSEIRFFSEKSTATIKDSIKNMAASVLNRYFYKQ